MSVARIRSLDAFAEEPRRALARAPAALSSRGARALGTFMPALVGGVLALGEHLIATGVVLIASAMLLLPWALARLSKNAAQTRLRLENVALTGVALAALLIAVALTAPSSPFIPLCFAVAVGLGAVVPARRLPLILVAAAAGVVGAESRAVPPLQLAVDPMLLVGFGVLGRALFFGTLKAIQVREAARVDGEILRLYDDARLFRLVGRDDGDAHELKRLVAQTLTVRDGCYRLLRLGARALSPDVSMLYVLDPSGKKLVLKEQVSDVDRELPQLIDAAVGAPGLALKKKMAIRLTEKNRSALCVPIRDGAQIRGVMLLERDAPRPFGDDDETLALALSEELVALMRTERILDELDIERRKKTRIFQAARAFGGVVRPVDAVEQTIQTVLDLAPRASVAVVEVLKDGQRSAIRVARTAGPGEDHLTSSDTHAINDEAWVGRCIVQRSALPHVSLADVSTTRGLYARDDGRAAAFGDLRAIPLVARDEVVAALVVAAPHGERFKPAVVDALLVIADLAGVALGGSLLFAATERMATTDGLTGLVNRRTLDGRLTEAVARARRTKGALTVVLSDVDHFKSVNDTYGHGTGDDVLKGVAATLQACARQSDVVARYGGEEFCLILEATDAKGAAQLAERMRLQIKAMRFETEKGPLSVTSSFGVAVLQANDDVRALLERADANLYRAKQAGRDRVMV